MRYLTLAALAAGACHGRDHRLDYLAYAWNDRRVLCSLPIDDLGNASDPRRHVDDVLALAADRGWVALLHAHTPGVTISTDMIEHVLATAEAEGLATVRFGDLESNPLGRPGVALAFDDDAVESWLPLRDVLARHHAQVTFFACCWDQLGSAQRTDLDVLASDGNDVEPHGAAHQRATSYVAARGLAAYLADEVQPSIDAIRRAGLSAAGSFAYPFGDHSPIVDGAVLTRVDRVRTTPGQCPY
jgi:hypothetical protein